MTQTSNPTTRTSHTPGPWRIEPWRYENGKRTVLTVQTDTDAIAQVLDLWCPDDRKDETDANARLIAAAPVLLEAAKEALSVFEEELLFNDPQASTQIEWEAEPLKSLRNAIRQATGGTQS